MQLTPIADRDLPLVLARFGRAVAGHPVASAAFARIAATRDKVAAGSDLPSHREAAVDLARSFGIPVLDEAPQRAFSWDGRVLRTRSEAYVVMHEVAHWQICPPDRCALPDFGLGAGPETGNTEAADAALAVRFDQREREERLASLLGILWEAALDQPAILAFLEQNWLEGWRRPGAAEAFTGAVDVLHREGFVDEAGRPTRLVRGSAAYATGESRG